MAVTLHYFGIFGRGEPIRMMLHYFNVPFTDHQVAMEEWPGLKSSGFTEFGQLPRLDIDGMELVQSQCIYRYVCQKNNAYPTDDHEIYLCESIVDLYVDIFSALGGMMFRKEMEKVQQYYTTNMPTFLRMIEKRLCDNDPDARYFVGRRVSMADFVMFELGWDCFCRAERRSYESILQSNAPMFLRFVQNFRNSNEGLRRYLDGRPEKPL
jgi:glutathione S-transferase